jgi:mycothione reductase
MWLSESPPLRLGRRHDHPCRPLIYVLLVTHTDLLSPLCGNDGGMTADVEKFDLVLFGTGSANSIVGPEFDDWKIAIVEEWVFGGTCLNRGCIPTKMLVHAADVAETVRHASGLGIDASVQNVRWRDIRDRVFGRIDPIAAGGEDYRTNRCPNITVFKGHGTFVGPKQIEVNGQVIEGRHVVVAVGARPRIPNIEGLDAVSFHTSDTIMRIDDLPKRLIVVGGGFIANELAYVFASFGCHVTIVHRGERLLSVEDDDISEAFTMAVTKRANTDLFLQATAKSVSQNANGEIALTLESGEVVVGDTLLIAAGRVPNTDTTNAGGAGELALHPDGRLVVDDNQRASIEGVWGLGDVSSPYMLKHVANHEARIVQYNLLHPESPKQVNHAFVPAAVFTRPQIASVGMTEAKARAAGIDVVTKTQNYGDVAYGWAMEDTTSFCKLVADRATRKLVGAHIIGPSASTLIQQLIQGMAIGQTVDQMGRDQYYIHPALPELIENALLGLEF